MSGGLGPQAVVDPADRRTAGENCPGRELPLCLPVVYSVHRMRGEDEDDDPVAGDADVPGDGKRCPVEG